MALPSRIPLAAAFAASLYPLAHLATATAWPEASRLLLSLGAVLVGAAAAAGLVRSFAAPRVIAVLALVWLVAALLAGGATALLAWLLYAAAAVALGAPLVGRLERLGPVERIALAYLAGVALLMAVLSLVLPLPIHHAAVYAAVCLAACLWQRRALGELLHDLRAAVREGMAWRPPLAIGTIAVLAAGVALWGAAGALTPITAYDDLAYHLRLPYELLQHKRYSFDVALHVWAAAPWAADLAFAVPFVLGDGNEGVKTWVAGSYHFAAAVLLLGLLVRRVQLPVALGLVAGYLAVPLLVAVNHTLHTEGISAALVLAAFVLWAEHRDAPSLRPALAAAVLVGLLGALKATNLVACLFLGLLWLPAWWRHVRARLLFALPLLAALATAAIPYITSWVRTGNPVLPLANALFKSPYFDVVNFSNSLFAGMFGPGLFGSLFLAGPRHLETSMQHAGGLVLFFLLPSTLLLLAWRGDAVRRAALAVALGYSLVLLTQQQYLRYLVPVMGLAVFAASRLWDEPAVAGHPRAKWWSGWWAVLLVAGAAATAPTMHRVFWQTPLPSILRSLDPAQRADYVSRYASLRELAPAADHELGAHARVLFLADPAGATLQGKAIYPNWYNRRAERDLHAVKDAAGAAAFLQAHGITHVAVNTISDLPPPARIVEAYARGHGRVAAIARTATLIALQDDLVWRRDLWSASGTPAISLKEAVQVAVPAAGAGTVLLEVEGACTTAAAQPAFEVKWERAGKPLRADTVFTRCAGDPAPGVFATRWRVDAPRGADTVRLWLGGANEQLATIRSARLRALGQPAASAAPM